MTPCIDVQLTVEDLIAFNTHMLASSARLKKQVRRVQVLMLPILVIGILWMWAMGSFEGPGGAMAWVLWLAFALVIVFLGGIQRRGVPGRVRRSVAQGGQRTAMAPTRLWVDQWGGLIVETVDRTTWYKPQAVTGIVETPEHVFIHVGDLQGLVIPRRVGEPLVQAFLEALKRHPSSAAGPQWAGVPTSWRP